MGSDSFCCRACLTGNEETSKNIADYWNDKLTYCDLLVDLIGTETTEDLPQFLCINCEKSLVDAFLFKRQCLNSEKIYLAKKEEDQIDADTQVADDLNDILEDDSIDQTEIVLPVQQESTTSKKSCLKCVMKFDSYKEYQSHYREMHRQKHVCSQCGKLVIRHNLEKHQLCHRNAKQHVCDECGKSFSLVENLRKHIRIHTREYRYECEHCGKKFIHWNSKRGHIRSYHTGEKNYECSVCGKKFAHSSNMLRHVRYHTGDLLHSCPYCAKKFNTSSDLKVHLVTHTKEKNEICEICSKAFGTRKALRNHHKIHTGERDYVCPVCNKAFSQPHVLRSHFKTHPEFSAPPPGTILSQKKLQKNIHKTKQITQHHEGVS